MRWHCSLSSWEVLGFLAETLDHYLLAWMEEAQLHKRAGGDAVGVAGEYTPVTEVHVSTVADVGIGLDSTAETQAGGMLDVLFLAGIVVT